MARRKYKDRVITSEEFSLYYSQWQVLIKSTLNKFRQLLDEHDLESCGNLALLLCIQRYDGRSNVKFSSLLVNYVNWECKRVLGQRMKYRDVAVECIDSKKRLKTQQAFMISDMLNSLNIEDRKMIQDRYINQLTLNEMASIYKVSRETIRKRLLKIRKKLIEDDENEI